EGFALGPGFEGGAQSGLHGRRIEIATYAENDVIGVNILLVPVDQVLARDRSDGGVLGHACVRIIGTVSEFGGLTVSDPSHIVVSPGDAIFLALFGDIDLVIAEFRILQYVLESFENVVKVALEAGEADRGGIRSWASFHLGGTHFEKIVKLVAGLGLGAAGTPDFAKDVDKARLIRRFVD